MPHPDYIRKLKLTGVGLKEPELRDAQLYYLKLNLSTLKEEEKLVNVFFDEIHVKQSVSYKAGNLQVSSFKFISHGDDPSSIYGFLYSFFQKEMSLHSFLLEIFLLHIFLS